MKNAALFTAVCLCLAITFMRCTEALPSQCTDNLQTCHCPNGETGTCWNQKCEQCEPGLATRKKRALFPFRRRARCYRESDCGSICTCKGRRCCCPWHLC